MTRNIRLLASASILASAAFAATPAFAEGTTAGTPVQNTVTLTYQVGGVDQSEETDSDEFIVDRKINLTVAEDGNITTTVVPGQEVAVTEFTVTNSSNDVIDIRLAATQIDGTAATHSGTDSFDLTGLDVYADTNEDGDYDVGTDLAIDYLDEMEEDETRTVFVVGAVPLSLANGAIAGVRLTGTAREGGVEEEEGAALTETAGANTASEDTVFADTNTANGNTARDAIDADDDDYTVSAAALTVTKTSRVVEDPLNGTDDPKMIPGATVEYCIAVSNAEGGATATGINISDDLDEDLLTFVEDSIFVNATLTAGACNEDGEEGGTYDEDVIEATLDDIAGGEALAVRFQVTID